MGFNSGFKGLMAGHVPSGVPLETCWAFNKLWNNKFYYKVAFCWYFHWVIYNARIHEYQIYFLSVVHLKCNAMKLPHIPPKKFITCNQEATLLHISWFHHYPIAVLYCRKNQIT